MRLAANLAAHGQPVVRSERQGHGLHALHREQADQTSHDRAGHDPGETRETNARASAGDRAGHDYGRAQFAVSSGVHSD